ncbi:MAG: hypothetical protein NVS3B19_14420 [Ginsengibacter sp.]
MNKSIYWLAALVLLMSSCTDSRFKKSTNGLEYKIISGNGGSNVKFGNTIKFTVVGYYKDSALLTGYDTIPQLLMIDSTNLPANYMNIFLKAKKGDSIVTRILVDSLLHYTPQIPSFAKKGNYLSTHIKIVDVLTDSALINKEKMAYMTTMKNTDSTMRAGQKAKDDKAITDYLTKNSITATKTAKGTYVLVENPGTGEAADSGKAVTVNYKGMTLAGNGFDSSYDPAGSGKAIKPFTMVVGQRGSIEGMDDGIRMFKKGGKGKLFIPSHLGYGPRGAGGLIKPNESLIFNVEVTDVQSGAEYTKKMEAQSKTMQEQQQRMQQMQQMQQQSQGQQRQGNR